jgi:hypothetical protein
LTKEKGKKGELVYLRRPALYGTISFVETVHPQNVRFQNVRFQNVWFQNVRFQNVRFTKRMVSKRMVSKRRVFKFDIHIKQKSICICHFYLLLAIMVIYDKKTSKIENKTQPSPCLQTWLQKNLRISTNHKYRIFIVVFLQPDVLKT